MIWGALALLLLSGCAPHGFSGPDVQIRATPDTVYLLARSEAVSRSLCASLGGDVALVEGRRAPSEGRIMQLARVVGCHTIRHIIVCPDDPTCLAHEERHKAGQFHP